MESIPHTSDMVSELNTFRSGIFGLTDEAFIQVAILLPHGFRRLSGAPEGSSESEISSMDFLVPYHVMDIDMGVTRSVLGERVFRDSGFWGFRV